MGEAKIELDAHHHGLQRASIRVMSQARMVTAMAQKQDKNKMSGCPQLTSYIRLSIIAIVAERLDCSRSDGYVKLPSLQEASQTSLLQSI